MGFSLTWISLGNDKYSPGFRWPRSPKSSYLFYYNAHYSSLIKKKKKRKKEKWVIKLFDVLSQEKEYILTQQTLVNNWSCNISVSVYSLTLCQRTPWVPESVTAEGTAYKRTSLKPRERKCSQTPLYGHPLNTDTSLLRTVCFVPGERGPLHFL